MQIEMISSAKKIKANFETLKEELEMDVRIIMKKIKQLQLKLITNIRNQENLNGLLVQDEPEYFKCLEMKHEQFNNLLQRDQDHWITNIDLSKKKSSALGQHIRDFI